MSSWTGVQDPELRQRIQVVRKRAEQRMKKRAQQQVSDSSKQVARSATTGRWIVVKSR